MYPDSAGSFTAQLEEVAALVNLVGEVAVTHSSGTNRANDSPVTFKFATVRTVRPHTPGCRCCSR